MYSSKGTVERQFFWQHRGVSFSGTPFILGETRKMDCQFGQCYYQEKKQEYVCKELEKLDVKHIYRSTRIHSVPRLQCP